MKRLEGKVAFITGAARGQGRSHAVKFAEEGADIVAVDVCEEMDVVEYPMSTEDDFAATVKMVEDLDRRMIAHKADVRDPAALDTAVAAGIAEFGHLDFVLANAGIMPIVGQPAESLDAWHAGIDIMLTGVLHTLRATVPHLVEADNGGAVVITSSTGGSPGRISTSLGMANPGLLGYLAAKHGVVGLMRAYASALAPHNIRVNTVHPTGVNSPMVANEAFSRYIEDHPEAVDQFQNKLPVQLIECADVSAAMVYLCSDDGRYVTGTTFHVDAGFTM